MKRLLIVTPSFLPNTAADMHRVRLAVPFATLHGWQVDILCVDPADNPSPRDDALLAAFPPEVRIHRVRAPRKSWHRWVGLNNLFRRAYRPLAQEGARLLEHNRFDLIYFSSTAFNTFALGPIWKARFGVPYVLDYQDPWVNDYYSRTGARPPGGTFKYAISQFFAKRAEPVALAEASGLTVVSSDYATRLKTRYGEVPRTIELPFPDDEAPWPIPDQIDPMLWTSVGRGGEDLHPAASALFSALSRARGIDSDWGDELRIRFLGTSYAPADCAVASLAPLAADFGLCNVTEEPTRISLGEARKKQAESGRLIALFSDDPGYRPSKLAGLISSGKPLVIVAPKDHPVVVLVKSVAGVVLITFPDETGFGQDQLALLKDQKPPQWPDSARAQFGQAEHAARLFGFLDSMVASTP